MNILLKGDILLFSFSIKSVFQGKGVAGSSTTLSASTLLIDSSRNIRNSMVTPATSGAKRSSVCLQTKFQLVCYCLHAYIPTHITIHTHTHTCMCTRDELLLFVMLWKFKFCLSTTNTIHHMVVF